MQIFFGVIMAVGILGELVFIAWAMKLRAQGINMPDRRLKALIAGILASTVIFILGILGVAIW